MKPRVEVRGDIGYRGSFVIRGVNVSFECGRLNCILGPNGSGKTTLLLTIGGALKPVSGYVRVEPRHARRVYIPPSPPYLPGLRVGDVALSVSGALTGASVYSVDAEIASRCDEILGKLGFKYPATRYFNELSTGERQKVMLAGALASRAEVLLLDEPNSHLDVKSRLTLYRLLEEEACRRLVIIALHDVSEASIHCNNILLLGFNGVVSTGSPEEVLCRENLERAYGVSFAEAVIRGKRVFLPYTSGV